MNDARQSQRGITIVEMLVSIVMTGVMAAAVIVFVVSTLRTYTTASIKADALAQAQTGLERISNDILLSASADVNNRIDDANSPVISDPLSWTAGTQTLILATAAEDTSRNLLFADASQYITHKNNVIYYRSGTTVMKRVLAEDIPNNRAKTTCPQSVATSICPADSIILKDVQTFTVTYYDHLNQSVQPDDARSVEVSVVLQRGTRTDTKVSYTTRTVFRND